MDQERKLWTREAVEAQVTRDFPDMDPKVVLAILDRYGLHGYHLERNRVHLAILQLSAGNIRDLIDDTEAAEQDYRDVLGWAADHSPRISAAESKAQAEDLIRRIGIDPDHPPKWIPEHLVCPVCGKRDPGAILLTCDDQTIVHWLSADPRKRTEMPAYRRGEDHQLTDAPRPVQKIALLLACPNDHIWEIVTHLSEGGAQWETIIRKWE